MTQEELLRHVEEREKEGNEAMDILIRQFRQADECLEGIRVIIAVQDKRIEKLEEELRQLKKTT